MNNNEQARLWNDVAGPAWVEMQESLDGMFEPLNPVLLEGISPGTRVLDVGCGTGATTLAAARRGGPSVGIDVSEPMLALARTRVRDEAATFLAADAQTHPFAAASFDRIISRFGVMFFADPVAAFANLHRATAAGGGLRLVTWRSAAENPFMTTAEHAAAPFLPHIPPRPADGPGQFAFADEPRVRRILEESGWRHISLRPFDATCTFPAKQLERYFTRLGPLGRVLADVDAATRVRVIDAVRAAFDPHVHGEEVRFSAACWEITALR